MIKDEKGSVTVIVLATVLFIFIVLGTNLVYISSKRKSQLQETMLLQNIYIMGMKGQDEIDNFYTEFHVKNTRTIGTLKEFTQFRDEVNNGETFEGITIKLTSDIDLSSVCSQESGLTWEPIGSKEHRFTGIFDGNGHAINNLYIDKDEQNRALFRIY